MLLRAASRRGSPWALRRRRLSTPAGPHVVEVDEWSWQWKLAGAVGVTALVPAVASMYIICCDGDTRDGIEAMIPSVVDTLRSQFGPFRGETTERVRYVRELERERATARVSAEHGRSGATLDGVRATKRLSELAFPEHVDALHLSFRDHATAMTIDDVDDAAGDGGGGAPLDEPSASGGGAPLLPGAVKQPAGANASAPLAVDAALRSLWSEREPVGHLNKHYFEDELAHTPLARLAAREAYLSQSLKQAQAASATAAAPRDERALRSELSQIASARRRVQRERADADKRAAVAKLEAREEDLTAEMGGESVAGWARDLDVVTADLKAVRAEKRRLQGGWW